MPPSIPTLSTSLNSLQLYSRRLLLHAPRLLSPGPAGSPDSGPPSNSFDANVVMILAVLLCALICALGINSIVRCALRCTGRAAAPGPVAARIASAAVRRKALRTLPLFVYSDGLKLPGSGSECAICLSDFATGERVRVLPKCGHGFHARCIDRWLLARPSCPTCRQCLFTASQKKSGCADVERSDPVPQVITPLEPEALVSGYR